MHEALSLDALPEVGRVDCALVDGDHNWYTVLNELRLLGRAPARGRAFPITFLHDVELAVRSPGPVPRSGGHPRRAPSAGATRRRGLGQAELSDDAGLSGTTYHAVEQGTPRNGVLTAVEDFVSESDVALRLERVDRFLRAREDPRERARSSAAQRESA